MEWNTIVVLSSVGTFLASVGIFVFVDRLERRHAAQERTSCSDAARAPRTATQAVIASDAELWDLDSEETDFGNASELVNDARLGLPIGWTKMHGTWADRHELDDTTPHRMHDDP